MIEIEILVKKCLPAAYLNDHSNIVIFYSGFSLVKYIKRE
jgi:hypothetical protein